ncbi:DUF1616 domain-containing protein [Candidatus Kuenenbacteria bacterium]|nr:DUF1616 domain-containing protein [Candidatus Kuenenbacteria bacterium]
MILKLYKSYSREIILFLLSLVCIIILLSAWYPATKSMLIVFGSVFTLFLPGFWLIYVFFPKKRPLQINAILSKNDYKALDKIERFILSIFLSITLLTLTLTVLRRIEIELSAVRVAFIIICINIVTAILAWIRYKK